MEIYSQRNRVLMRLAKNPVLTMRIKHIKNHKQRKQVFRGSTRSRKKNLIKGKRKLKKNQRY